MIVDVCGVRGSTPAPGVEFAGVGGHTSCLAIRHRAGEPPVLILDAGTGIRRVDGLLEDGPFRGAVLLTHLHWDHTHGLPFFTRADRDDAEVTLLLPDQGVAAEAAIAGFMSPPAFPIGPEGLRGRWTFESIDEGSCRVQGFTVEAREIPHGGGRTFGYRISDESSSMAYLPDHGPRAALGAGPDGWGPYHQTAMDLCRGVDLLVHDAQHVADELERHFRFGHSAADYAVELGRRCGVTAVLLFHHHPNRTDEEVADIVRGFAGREGPFVFAAREGDVIDVGEVLAGVEVSR